LRRILAFTLALSLHGTALAATSSDLSLRGSRAGMIEQNQVAKDHGLSFLRTPDQVQAAVASGDLVPLEASDTYEVAEFVSHPYTVPAVRSFVEWLSTGYVEACGQKLVVTSAVRAISQQPRNASPLSVHPAGMAVDLRVSDLAACREWLEGTLLDLKGRGIANGIRESSPPHYHVAVYPEPYLAFLEERIQAERAERAEQASRIAARPVLAALRAAARDPGSSGGAEASPAGGSNPKVSRASPPAMLVSFSVTALMGAVGGWLVFGSSLIGIGGWIPRVRRRFEHRGR
jgi:hypothetical protein